MNCVGPTAPMVSGGVPQRLTSEEGPSAFTPIAWGASGPRPPTTFGSGEPVAGP